MQMKNNQTVAEYTSAIDKYYPVQTIHGNRRRSNSKVSFAFCPQGLNLLFAGLSAANKK